MGWGHWRRGTLNVQEKGHTRGIPNCQSAGVGWMGTSEGGTSNISGLGRVGTSEGADPHQGEERSPDSHNGGKIALGQHWQSQR